MDAQSDVNRGEFTWKISYFSEQEATRLYSEAFTVAGCKWRILLFPKGNNTDHLSLYISVPDPAALPNWWTRKAKLILSVIDQTNDVRSVKKGTQHVFSARQIDRGYQNFIPLTELHNCAAGYLANDTLVIKAEVCILAVTPPVNIQPLAVIPPVNIQPARPTDGFDSYLTSLEEIINAAETNGFSVGSSLGHHDGSLTAKIPSLEEVGKAKQSLKECLSDLFKLNMKERLSEALSTLSSARTGLSPKQRTAIDAFRANFNDFTSDFLTFEQDNAEFELQKLQMDQWLVAVTKCHEAHIVCKQLMGELVKEEEELKRKMEEVKSRKDKLFLDWDVVQAKSEEAKSGYKDKQKKVAEAEEKKRIAEERMSRSATAWSNLKTQFC